MFLSLFEETSIEMVFSEVAHLLFAFLCNFLDQPMLSKKSIPRKIARTRYFGRVVFIAWYLWAYMMIVFIHAYKGIMFSYITTNDGFKWPATLKELMDHPNYVAFSNEQVTRIDGKRVRVMSMLQSSFLEPLVTNKTAGKDFSPEYLIPYTTL